MTFRYSQRNVREIPTHINKIKSDLVEELNPDNTDNCLMFSGTLEALVNNTRVGERRRELANTISREFPGKFPYIYLCWQVGDETRYVGYLQDQDQNITTYIELEIPVGEIH